MEAENTIQQQAANNTQTQSSEGQPSGQESQPTKQDRISSKMEVLIKRERAAIEAEQRLKARQAEYQPKFDKLTEFEAARSTPLKALELLGLDYNQLSQTVLNDGNIPADVLVNKLKGELEELKSSLSQKDQQTAEYQKQQAQNQLDQAVEGFKSQIISHIDQHKDKYELIKFEQADLKVYELIDKHYQETIDPDTGIGEILDIEVAADKLEKQLEDKYSKAKDINKFKSLFQPESPKGMANQIARRVLDENKLQSGFQPRQRTLTNNLSSTPMKPPSRPLTDDQRAQAAIFKARELLAKRGM